MWACLVYWSSRVSEEGPGPDHRGCLHAGPACSGLPRRGQLNCKAGGPPSPVMSWCSRGPGNEWSALAKHAWRGTWPWPAVQHRGIRSSGRVRNRGISTGVGMVSKRKLDRLFWYAQLLVQLTPNKITDSDEDHSRSYYVSTPPTGRVLTGWTGCISKLWFGWFNWAPILLTS